jgi:hypothetical protein
MNCETARMLLTFFGRRGSELAAEDAAALDAHVAGCPGCAARLRDEQAFDDRVGRAMLNITVPATLRGKIADSLAAERGAWFRGRAAALAGVVAALVLGFGGYVGYQIQTAPVLTADAVVHHADQQVNDRAGRISGVLSEHGMRYNPQRAFDLNQLGAVGTESLMGRAVPVLHFRNLRRNTYADVYVVSDRTFNWKALDPADATFRSEYGHQVVVIPDAVRGDVGYIVVYTGDSLDVFLETTSSN